MARLLAGERAVDASTSSGRGGAAAPGPGIVEPSLLASTESVAQHRKRRELGLAPTYLDVMFAVQRARQQVEAEAQGGDSATATAAAAASPAQALAAQRHAERQSAAKQALADAVQAPPSARTAGSSGSARLEALVAASDALLGRAHWLPRDEAYPTDGNVRRRVLLAEARAIYSAELPRAGLQPDIVTLNTMVAALCNAKQRDAAYAFLRTEFPARGLAPDARTYRSLIRMHVAQRDTAAAQAALADMRARGVRPDADAYGLLVHAAAREWRVKDALALVREAREAGLAVNEHYAFLLRQRCKELGVAHPDVPEHPVGWQFTPAVMEKRRASGRVIRKVTSTALRPQLQGGWR
jgi:pentatricopeptide repeat protein